MTTPDATTGNGKWPGAGNLVAETRRASRAVLAAPETGSAPAPLIQDLLSASRLLDREYPPIAYAIDPLAPRGEVCEWVGPHAAFKSTLALAACLSVASGRRFGGFAVAQGDAVFLTAEDSERTIATRVRAWLESVPIGPERAAATKAIRERFYFLAREHVRGLALTMLDYGEPGPRAATIARLQELVSASAIAAFETAARLADGNENENRVQATFAQALEEIAIGSGAAVLIVRHVSKQAARDDTTDSYAGRGGGALSDAARSVVNFTRPGPKNGEKRDALAPVVMTHAKSTLCRPAEPVVWQPIEAPNGGVYLRALSDDETVRANAVKLLAAVPPEGVTATDLHKRPQARAGLSRSDAEAALALLKETGRLVVLERPHGAGHKAPVTVYTRPVTASSLGRCGRCGLVPGRSAPTPTMPGTDGHRVGAVRPSLKAAPTRRRPSWLQAPSPTVTETGEEVPMRTRTYSGGTP